MPKLLTDIKFWLLLFFVVRLVGITNPPLEKGHNWRQATGLMVARNFLEVDNDIRYPRVDDHAGQSGIIGMEFPLLNYSHYLVSEVFGYTHWYGRLINLLVSTLGIYYFYCILARYFNPKMALYASVVLLSSIWFAFSRKMMPDTFCIALMMVGLYYGLRFFDEKKPWQLLLFVLFAGLGILSKIPAGIYLAVFALPLWHYRKQWKTVLPWLAGTALVLCATWTWYFVWDPHLADTYGNWYNAGQDLDTSVTSLAGNLGNVLERFYFSALHSYVFLLCFVGGLVWAVKQRQYLVLGAFLLVLGVFVLYVLRSGFFFQHHNYYIIPFVPVMAMVAGYGLSQINRQWLVVALLAAGVVEGTANQWHDFMIKPSEKYKLTLETIADKVSAPGDWIAINGNGNPQQIYLSHRKGWTLEDNEINDFHIMDVVANSGCKYLFVNKHTHAEMLPYQLVYEDEHYAVYSLADFVR